MWDGGLTDTYLRQVTQLGADCIDFGNGSAFPGVKEQGYPELDELLKIKKRIRSWGLDINRGHPAEYHRTVHVRTRRRG